LWKFEYPSNQSTIAKIMVNFFIARKIGQRLRVTKWKGWINKVIFLNKQLNFLNCNFYIKNKINIYQMTSYHCILTKIKQKVPNMLWKLENSSNQSTIPKNMVKLLIAPKIGQRLKGTKWKGWLKYIIVSSFF